MSVGRSPVTIIIVRPMHMSTAAMVPTMMGVLTFVLSGRDVPCSVRPACFFLGRKQHVSLRKNLILGLARCCGGCAPTPGARVGADPPGVGPGGVRFGGEDGGGAEIGQARLQLGRAGEGLATRVLTARQGQQTG